MSNGGKRDLVRFEANERVDLPDLQALQDNGRSETRMAHHTLITGQGDNTWADAAGTLGGFDGNRVILKPWPVALSGTEVSVTAGLALGAVNDAASDSEWGVWFGGDGDTSQTIDVGAYADGVYHVRVRPVFDAATPATRVFWDGTNNTEAANSMDTRKVFGWTTSIELATAADDGESIVIAALTIASGVITSAFEWNFPLLEPGYIKNLLTSTTLANIEWFKALADTDPNLRDSTQASENPIVSLVDWCAFVRGQITMILNDGGYWRQGLPETTTDHLGSIGDKVSLAQCRDHIDDTIDPHGDMTLTGTTTMTDAQITDATIASGIVTALTIPSGGTLTTSSSSGTISFGNGFTLPNAGGAVSNPGDLPKFSADSDDSDAYHTQRWIAGMEFYNRYEVDAEDIRRSITGIMAYNPTTSETVMVAYMISGRWASSALASGGPYLDTLQLLIQPPDDIAAHGGFTAINAGTTVLQWQLYQASPYVEGGTVIGSGTITRSDCGWTSDTDVGVVTIDLSGMSESERTASLFAQHFLTLTLYNQRDAANASDFSVNVRGALITYAERLLHP